MALEFHTYGTGVSYLWHWSFIPMALEFLPYETRVPRGVGTELGLGAFAQGVVIETFATVSIIDTMRGAIRLGG